jgi:hypothetical protein
MAKGWRGDSAGHRAAALKRRAGHAAAARSRKTFKSIYKRLRKAGRSKTHSTEFAFYQTTKTAGANSRMGKAFGIYMGARKRNRRRR